MARVERLCPICRRVIMDRTRTKCPNFRRHVATHEEKPMATLDVFCGKCGERMTPENARLRPELFLHDACLPDVLKPAAGPNRTEAERIAYQLVATGQIALVAVPAVAQAIGGIEAARDLALDACRAAVRYDESIAGSAARGEVLLTAAGTGVAEGDGFNNLDELYEDWIRKSRAALAGR